MIHRGRLFVIITIRHLSFPLPDDAQETFDRRQASLRARALGTKSSLSLEDRVDKHVQAMDHVLQLFLIDELLYQSQHLQVHKRYLVPTSGQPRTQFIAAKKVKHFETKNVTSLLSTTLTINLP
jgi:hypothetical protein